jgi:hypothetical protein
VLTFQIYEIVNNVNYSQSHIRKQIRLINKFLLRYKSKIVYNTQNRTYSILSKKEIALHYLIVEIMKITSSVELPELSQQQKNDFDQLFFSILTQFPSDTQETFELLFRAEKVRVKQNLVDENRSFNYVESLKNVHDTEVVSKARVYVEEHLRWYYSGLKTNLKEEDYLVMTDIVTGYILRSYILPERFDSYLNRYDMFLHDFARVNPKYIGAYMDFLDDINTQSGVNVSDYAGEILYHIYTSVLNVRNYSMFNIGVYSDLGKVHAKSIIKTFTSYYSGSVFSCYDITQEYDVILTTTALKFKDYKGDATIVTVSDLIVHQDLANLFGAIYNKHFFEKLGTLELGL